MKIVIQTFDEFNGYEYLNERNQLSSNISEALIFKSVDDAERYIEESNNNIVNEISYFCDFAEIL